MARDDATAAAIVVRPSPRAPRALRMLVEAGVLWALLVALIVFLESSGRFALGWVILGGATAWYWLLPWLYFRNTSLYVVADRVGKTDLLGRRTDVDAERVAAVRIVRAGRRTRTIRLDDAAGEALISTYSTAWRREQVEALRGALGLADDAPRGER